MIIRNIISNPDQPFDYFNDYQDTHNWLLGRLADPASDVALVFIALNTLEAGNV